MGKFNRNNKDRGFRDSRKFSGGFRPGGHDRPEMFPATCGECGQRCQVPFRPTGERAVLCTDCFRQAGGGPKKFGGRDFSRPSFSEKKPAFEAICDGCGQRCQVPFRPTGEKEVFCRACFGGKKDGGGAGKMKTDELQAQFALINAKLDKILKATTPTHTIAIEEQSNEDNTILENRPAKKKAKKADKTTTKKADKKIAKKKTKNQTQ